MSSRLPRSQPRSADGAGPVSRRDLLEIYLAGIRAADGRARVADDLAGREPPARPVRLIAVGKSAPAMARGALEAWAPHIVGGIVITRHGYRDPALDGRAGLSQLESGHPVPDETSLAAGQALRDHVLAADPAEQLLFLISGGASSLVEVLPEGVSLADLRRVSDWLLGSGLDIAAVNAVRRGLSTIKDGRLAHLCAERAILALYVSDVAGDAPWDIGSGLLSQAPARPLPPELPPWVARLLESGPPRSPASVERVEHRIVASLETALAGCEAAAAARAYAVHRHPGRLDLDVTAAAAAIVDGLGQGGPGIHLWGGETTVRLPAEPGRGGRNQHLALACAISLAGDREAMLLCGATDGSDGPGEDAGALIDGGSLERAAAEGYVATDCLARADAGRCLEAAGDLISTGPTGTNVNDLVIGLTRCGG